MAMNRRVFLKWSAVVSAWVGAARRAVAAPVSHPAPQAAGLAANDLLPLAEAVLPTELGAAGIVRATNEFAALVGGYRPDVETLHPYGSDRLGKVAPFAPGPWIGQLRDLDVAARARHGRAFAAATVAQRTALVRDAVDKAGSASRIAQPLAAPHVALGLLAHFLESPAAVNLAYRRVIDPRQCRPLSESSRVPVPLRRAGGGGTGQ